MWKDHGTKIIGAVGTVLGMFAAMSPDQVTSILGQNGQGYLMAGLSLLTMVRGFQNAKVNGQTPEAK